MMGRSRHGLEERFFPQAMVTGLACTCRVPATAQRRRLAGGPYIDVHTHVGRTWNGQGSAAAFG